MAFAHDTEVALLAAVALINSASVDEGLTNLSQLDQFTRQFTYTGKRTRSATELEEVRSIRPILRKLLLSRDRQAAGQVNRILRDFNAQPQLVRHDDLDWHIHAIDASAPLAARIMVEVAIGMIDVIRTNEFSRIMECEADDCSAILVDLSRNRSKRFCSETCANRVAVRAYRERRATNN